MKRIEFMLTWEDHTWTTEIIEVPTIQEDRRNGVDFNIGDLLTDALVDWANKTLLVPGNSQYDGLALFAVYNTEPEEPQERSVLSHWRHLYREREAIGVEMQGELSGVIGRRAVFHGMSPANLRAGRIDSVKSADCLVIVDEKTAEVCLAGIEQIKEIDGVKLPKTLTPQLRGHR